MLDDAAPQLTALSDATRRAMFEILAREPCSVGELASRVPVSRPAGSQQLRVLEHAKLVTHTSIVRGTWIGSIHAASQCCVPTSTSGTSIRTGITTADETTHVEVSFLAEGSQVTRVALEHRGLERFGERAQILAAAIGSHGGWTDLLEAMRRRGRAACARGSQRRDDVNSRGGRAL